MTKRRRRRNPKLGPAPVLTPVDYDQDGVLEPEFVGPIAPDEMAEIPVAQGGSSLSYIPSSIALQIFGNTAGIAGALVGFALAYKVRSAKAMSLYETLLASGVIVAVTFGSVFFIRSFK
jgi:hypothetical protein